jgi:NAD(P)-dependent dehydrogenase (short-subunit alcohol dehydrogenase family)
MKYLITGASSGAGKAVFDLLTATGHECVAWHHHEGLPDEAPYDGIFHAAGIEKIALLRNYSSEKFAPMFKTVEMLIELLAIADGHHGWLKDGGSIVAMSSVAAVCGTPGMSLYSASKGAIESLVRSAAIELAPRGIRVNAIRAGGFHSPMNQRIADRIGDFAYESYKARHPLGLGTSEDIAKVAQFLFDNKWLTGSILTVDGGYSAK